MSGNLYPSYGLSGATKTRGISGTTKGGKNCLDVNVLSNVGSTGGFITLQKVVTTAGTPVQLSSDAAVSLGVKVTIKAKSANTKAIYIGYSSATALHTNTSYFKLESNENIELSVSNLNLIWLDSEVNGEGVEVIYEN